MHISMGMGRFKKDVQKQYGRGGGSKFRTPLGRGSWERGLMEFGLSQVLKKNFTTRWTKFGEGGGLGNLHRNLGTEGWGKKTKKYGRPFWIARSCRFSCEKGLVLLLAESMLTMNDDCWWSSKCTRKDTIFYWLQNCLIEFTICESLSLTHTRTNQKTGFQNNSLWLALTSLSQKHSHLA